MCIERCSEKTPTAYCSLSPFHISITCLYDVSLSDTQDKCFRLYAFWITVCQTSVTVGVKARFCPVNAYAYLFLCFDLACHHYHYNKCAITMITTFIHHWKTKVKMLCSTTKNKLQIFLSEGISNVDKINNVNSNMQSLKKFPSILRVLHTSRSFLFPLSSLSYSLYPPQDDCAMSEYKNWL